MSAYREPGRDVDVTAIECEKVRQDGETKRVLIEQREQTKRKRVDEIGYAPHIATTIVFIVAAVTGGLLTNAWFEKRAQSCVEESWKKDSYNGVKCLHPLHVLVQDEKTWGCKCGRPAVGETK